MSEEIAQLSEEVIKGQLKELVSGQRRGDAQRAAGGRGRETDPSCLVCVRNEQRQGYRSGHCSRNLTIASGDVTLKVPKLKGISFETAIFGRYRRRKSSEKEALIEMYLVGDRSGVWRTLQ